MKILITGGIHGDEVFAKELLEHFKSVNDFENVEIVNSISPSDTRRVCFDLNRVSDIEALNDLSWSMKHLIQLVDECDVLIDIHNSPTIKDMFLLTSKPDKKCDDVEKGSLDAICDVQVIDSKNFIEVQTDKGNVSTYWRLDDKVDSLSQYARAKGKIGLTFEVCHMAVIPDITIFEHYTQILKDVCNHYLGNSTKNKVLNTKYYDMNNLLRVGHYSGEKLITEGKIEDQEVIKNIVSNSNEYKLKYNSTDIADKEFTLNIIARGDVLSKPRGIYYTLHDIKRD